MRAGLLRDDRTCPPSRRAAAVSAAVSRPTHDVGRWMTPSSVFAARAVVHLAPAVESGSRVRHAGFIARIAASSHHPMARLPGSAASACGSAARRTKPSKPVRGQWQRIRSAQARNNACDAVIHSRRIRCGLYRMRHGDPTAAGFHASGSLAMPCGEREPSCSRPGALRAGPARVASRATRIPHGRAVGRNAWCRG